MPERLHDGAGDGRRDSADGADARALRPANPSRKHRAAGRCPAPRIRSPQAGGEMGRSRKRRRRPPYWQAGGTAAPPCRIQMTRASQRRRELGKRSPGTHPRRSGPRPLERPTTTAPPTTAPPTTTTVPPLRQPGRRRRTAKPRPRKRTTLAPATWRSTEDIICGRRLHRRRRLDHAGLRPTTRARQPRRTDGASPLWVRDSRAGLHHGQRALR